MDAKQTVLDRIRKLLNLAKRGTEHEAALAAEHAQRLILEHKLSEAQIPTDETAAPAAAPVEELRVAGPKTNVKWMNILILAASRAMFCESFYNSGTSSFRIIGTRTDMLAAVELFEFLKDQVEREARAYVRGFYKPSRTIGFDFRVGCVSKIAKRLRASREEAVAKAQIAVGQTTALVVVERSERAIGSYIAEHHPGVRFRTSRANPSEHRNAGMAAGERIRLQVERKIGRGA